MGRPAAARWGAAITILRVARGWSQRDLAGQVGCDAAHLSLVESGRRAPALDMVGQIVAALGIARPIVDALVAGTPESDALLGGWLRCALAGDDPTDFARASGDAICPACRLALRRHPHDASRLGYDGAPYLRRLCDGTLVKL